MTIGMLVLILNAGGWWFLFSRAPKLGAKFVLCVMALLNSWILLDRAVFHTGAEHQGLAHVVARLTGHAGR